MSPTDNTRLEDLADWLRGHKLILRIQWADGCYYVELLSDIGMNVPSTTLHGHGRADSLVFALHLAVQDWKKGNAA